MFIFMNLYLLLQPLPELRYSHFMTKMPCFVSFQQVQPWLAIKMIFLEYLPQILISIPIWPVIIITTLLNEVVRFFISLYFLIADSKYSLVFLGTDAFFESNKAFHTNTVLCLLTTAENRDLSLQKEREVWTSRVLSKSKYDRFKSIICRRLGYSCWRNDADRFDVSNHVKIYDYSKPSNPDYFTEEELLTEICKHL